MDRTGIVKNFDLAQFLSDCEEPDSLQAWAIGDDGYIGPKESDVAGACRSKKTKEKKCDWQLLTPYDCSVGGAT